MNVINESLCIYFAIKWVLYLPAVKRLRNFSDIEMGNRIKKNIQKKRTWNSSYRRNGGEKNQRFVYVNTLITLGNWIDV